MSVTLPLSTQIQRARAQRMVGNAPEDCVVIIRKKSRTDEQNRLMWPLLEDLRRQVPQFKGYTRDDIKLVFLNALKHEMRFLPELDGAGMFPVGLRSSTLSKEQFSGLLELIYEFGARNGVVWSEPREEAA